MLPISVWILISGLDDLLVDCFCGFYWFCHRFLNKRKHTPVTDEQLSAAPQKLIAIFVPLWHEHAVIGNMIRHNFSAVRYRNYHFFIGAYPNDEATLGVVGKLERMYVNVHLATCPHDGPTSKADCLNWIYQRMLQYEADRRERFEIIATHDAEDLIHPDSLLYMNWYAERFDMLQVPVLPLPSRLTAWTHGIYCDEFAETQMKDLRARQFFGSYIPSCGVGTAFARGALEKLAVAEKNRIFEPACLTEDYENGMRLHLMGARQLFLPLRRCGASWVATREYFPQSFRSAVRQRTRWITGISLQAWERHGWEGSITDKYWLWRDRKGLVGNPITLLTNTICLYGLVTMLAGRLTHTPWQLGQILFPAAYRWVLAGTLLLGLGRLLSRAVCAARIYGIRFALGAPVRMVWANVINSFAAVSAICRFARAKVRRLPLVWLKTEHEYPSQAALQSHKRRLGELLVGSDYITAGQLDFALSTMSEGTRLGEHLIKLGYLAERDLYDALSLQQSLPAGRVYSRQVPVNVARALPAKIALAWKVLPFKIESGRLFVAGPEFPSEAMQKDLRRFTSLEIRFQLITPGNYKELAEALL